MHRATDEGVLVEDEFRRYIDQNLPGEAGTKVPGEDLNAIQEELCNIITLTGGTVLGEADRTTAALIDRTAGWRQVHDAIFSGGNIGNAAITDDSILLDKIDFPALRTSGTTSLGVDTSYLVLSSTDGAAGRLQAQYLRMTDPDDAEMYVEGRGVRFSNGPGDATFKAKYLRQSAFTISQTMTWTQVGSTGSWLSAATVVVDIPEALTVDCVLSAHLQFTYVGGTITCPATVKCTGFTGGNLTISTMYAHTGYLSDVVGDDFLLILEYDATSLVVT